MDSNNLAETEYGVSQAPIILCKFCKRLFPLCISFAKDAIGTGICAQEAIRAKCPFCQQVSEFRGPVQIKNTAMGIVFIGPDFDVTLTHGKNLISRLAQIRDQSELESVRRDPKYSEFRAFLPKNLKEVKSALATLTNLITALTALILAIRGTTKESEMDTLIKRYNDLVTSRPSQITVIQEQTVLSPDPITQGLARKAKGLV